MCLFVCCSPIIKQRQSCVMAVIFIRAVRSGMITIWVARFGLRVSGHGLVLRASPALIMKHVMSDNNHLIGGGVLFSG